MKFKLIDTEHDGRIIRQTFAKPFANGQLILVSTTIFANHAMPDFITNKTEVMAIDVPIEHVSESIVFVPNTA